LGRAREHCRIDFTVLRRVDTFLSYESLVLTKESSLI